MASRLWLIIVLLFARMIHGYHLVPRHEPLLTRAEFDGIAWSPNNLQLTRRGHLYVYHNYTLIEDGRGRLRPRYLTKETILHHKRVVRSRFEHFEPPSNITLHSNVTKRGFHANPNVGALQASFLLPVAINRQIRYATWNWKREGHPRCSVRIGFCFGNAEDQRQLNNILWIAINRWNTALGRRAGVVLDIAPGHVCRDRNGNWRPEVDRDTVEVYLGDDKSYNGLGWLPGTAPGRMRIQFDLGWPPPPFPQLWGAQQDVHWTAQMTHEIGHVLGLLHEHQRYDATRHIRFNWHNLSQYNRLQGCIDEYNQQTNSQITDQMLFRDATLVTRVARQLGGARWRFCPPLGSLAPYVRQNDPIELVDHEEFGQFDFDSIMLYGSHQGSFWGSTGRLDEAVMVKVSDGSAWGNMIFQNNLISRGDVAAVKHMYPDV